MTARPKPVPVPPSWRQAVELERQARIAAALQRPQEAAALLRRAADGLREAAGMVDSETGRSKAEIEEHER